jgi:hypothetical protein
VGGYGNVDGRRFFKKLHHCFAAALKSCCRA